MTPPRNRLSVALDRVIGCVLVALILGSSLAFGGATWWGPAAIAALATLLGASIAARAAIEGRWTLLRSPLGAIGAAALALAVVQLAPLPAGLAARVSPRAHAAHAGGIAPNSPAGDRPGSSGRTPATLDRPATLRWLLGAAAGLVLFAASAHFADRLSRSMIVWGSVAAAFAIGSVLGLAQALADSGGFYGAIEPGSGFPGAPTLADVAQVPGSTAALRLSADPRRPRQAWPVSRPARQFQVGGLPGGPGAYLALASIGLPMALGLALQTLAPRGSREPLRARLRESNRGGLAVLLGASTVVGSAMSGYLGGAIPAVPFAIGLLVVGIPSTRGTGLRWAAPALLTLALVALAGGVILGDRAGRPAGSPTIAGPGGFEEARVAWGEAARIARDFPLLGSGLGSFPAVSPYYKSVDRASTTAEGGLFHLWAEAGLAGLAIAAIAATWSLIRLPGAIRGVGSADRAIAFGLVGSVATSAAIWALIGPAGPWSVTLAACAVGGTWNRWMAGGTDLFVESD